MRNTIIHGDALEELRKLPDESVHCCVCSPPYWGLRDYELLPLIRGGDRNCRHEWDNEIIAKSKDSNRGDMEWSTGGAPGAKVLGKHPSQGQFCLKCGAWRGSLGLEPQPELYIQHLVEIFREVKRVLRDDGTLWLNMGDSYAGSWGNSGRRPELDDGAGGQRPKNCDYLPRGGWDNRRERPPSSYKIPGLKPKDLVGIPWMVAFALRADGWWLRKDIIWAKPNPMPESCTDRPTSSHEHIFLLAKSGASIYWTHRDLSGIRSQPKPDYRWFDRANNNVETADEPPNWYTELLADGETKRWQRINLWRGHDYFYDQDAIREPHVDSADIHRRIRKDGKYRHDKSQRGWMEGSKERADQAVSRGRNKRDVWWIATKPFPDAHFAVYPPELIRPCILAGTSERGCCPKCGAPWERVIKKRPSSMNIRVRDAKKGILNKKSGHSGRASASDKEIAAYGGEEMGEVRTIGWRPTCSCDASEPIPCIVLDPFFGAGTTGLVAKQEGRHCLGIELGLDNVELARARIKRECPMDRLL